MRKNYLIWSVLSVGQLVILFVWHEWLSKSVHVTSQSMQMSYVFGYALLALLFLGVIARLWPTGHPALWRMLTVVAGAVLVAGEISLHDYPRHFFLPLWAAALIGISLISVAARMLPVNILNIWFDLESK